MAEYLTLKWGTLKAWNAESEASRAALHRYFDEPVAMGAMQQDDSPEQVQAILDLIDAIDCQTIENDWEGTQMTKEEAKQYIKEYPRKAMREAIAK